MSPRERTWHQVVGRPQTIAVPQLMGLNLTWPGKGSQQLHSSLRGPGRAYLVWLVKLVTTLSTGLERASVDSVLVQLVTFSSGPHGHASVDVVMKLVTFLSGHS